MGEISVLPHQHRCAVAWCEVPTSEEGNEILDKILQGHEGDGKIGLKSGFSSSLMKRMDALGGVL